MTNQISKLQDFEPGVFILINDVMTGIRKLARVTETGQTYIDLDASDCTPMPIYETLQPEEAGNILGWGLYIVDNKPELHASWKALCDQLIGSGEGVLTYNRAAHWAITNECFDFDRAMAAGKLETATVASGRNALDKMVTAGGGI